MSEQNNNNNFSQDNQKQPGAYYDGASPQNNFSSQFDQQFNNNQYASPPNNTYNPNNTGANSTYTQDPNNGAGQYNQNPNYNGYSPQLPPKAPADGLSIVSLVCSIISVILCWFFPLTILFAIVGIVCGLLSKKVNGKKSGLAVAGIIVSIIMLLVGIVSAIIIIVGFSQFSFSSEFDEIFKELEKLN